MRHSSAILPTFVFLGGLFLVLGVAGSGDVEEERRQLAAYCENVQLWKKTGREFGHPDYNGIYPIQCEK